MGEQEGWAEPNGLLPNGLLPNLGEVIRVLDTERWLKAEERIAELIACIQPNEPSEGRRNAVADYVQRLIMKCFPCQVFTFGSVPLKTYLPDGDIDLTAFSNNQTLKDTWAHQVRDMLENEEKNAQAEFRVKEVQYIQAEVKIIKCLVENIVVDISFNQLGGLCTLCFLEEVDHLINHNHLFKRSIILIKAWCYYESRILGAHHGLISTYALETLVLYIFHVFNNSFTGPLEVLYRFLEFFSKFDWDNFCVSLWGPVPISSLPDVTAEPPRKDGGNLLLSKLFLDACSTVYAVFPSGPENQSQPFHPKNFNVIDPLRVNNNLGRSVSKGNFYRIRSAFAFGAKRLARLLDCPKENLINEVNQFFKNTWDRHGSGRRPDAPETDMQDKSDNVKSNKGRKSNDVSVGLVNSETSPVTTSQPNQLYGSISRRNDLSTNSSTHVNVNSSRASDHTARESTSSNHVGHVDEGQRNMKSGHLVNNINGRFAFARTHSSPELSDMSTKVGRHRVSEGSKTQTTSTRLDGNNRKTNQPSTDDFSSVRMTPSPQGVDAVNEELGTLGMNQEEQDLVNMMESTTLNHFNGQVPLPFTIPPSFLASLGYTQRNLPGLVPSMQNMHFPHGLVPQPLAPGLNPNLEYFSEQNNNENFGSVEAGNGFWQDQDVTENGSLEMLQSDERYKPAPRNFNIVAPSWLSGSGTLTSFQPKDEHLDNYRVQDNVGAEALYDERTASSRFSSASHSNSLRSRAPEGSWDGSSAKVSKSTRERRGKKVGVAEFAGTYGKGKTMPEHTPNYVEDDDHEWDEVQGSEVAAQSSSSEPTMPGTQMFTGSGSLARDNSGLVAFYPTGPPVPFLTMLPVYDDIASETGAPDTCLNFDSTEGLDNSEDINMDTCAISDEYKPDILNSDFASHFQNMQFGRFCQNPPNPGPMFYQTPVMIPPGYLQGRFPWDGPGRPLPTNFNVLTQLMGGGYGSRVGPVAPVQSLPNRPLPNVYQRFADDIPKHRSGTGTYLPNPKVLAVRDRPSSNSRRVNYHYDRNDSHGGDREGNWNGNSKTRGGGGGGRVYNRNNQAEKSFSRLDRFSSTSESRADRSWTGPYRNEHVSPFTAQNGVPSSFRAANSITGGGHHPPNVAAYGPNTSAVPSVVMLYPFEQEQLEFGSLGPLGGVEATTSGRRSSPDQPSSPRRRHRRN